MPKITDAQRRENRIAAGLPLGEEMTERQAMRAELEALRAENARLRAVLEDPELAADMREIMGRHEWGDARSERAKEQVRRTFVPHTEAVVKMLRQRAGLKQEENHGTGTGP